MKILLVNGSPRQKGSTSELVLQSLKKQIGPQIDFLDVYTFSQGSAMLEHTQADSIVIAFPLYVDSLPYGLIQWLTSFEQILNQTDHKAIPLFAVVNCGFYEAIQNKTALDIIHNFCIKCGLMWNGGIGIGTGGMMLAVKNVPDHAWIKKPISQALKSMAQQISRIIQDETMQPLENRYVTHKIPRFLYKLMAESGWKQMIKKNGLKVRDLKIKSIV